MQIKIADYKKPQKRIPKYYYYENRFFPDFRRARERIWKLSRDQDGDNDIRYSPIGSTVFELLGDIQTYRHRAALVYRIYNPALLHMKFS